MKFQYPKHIQSMARLREDLAFAASALALPGPELRQIRVIAEELFSRMVKEDEGAGAEEEVTLVLERAEASIRLEMAHRGRAHNPLQRNEPHRPDPLMQEESGMGMALIDAFADHLEYRYEKGVNRVWIRKDIRSKTA
jgi:anti-sigma regulatory factor (Ser/Thr protein kinase)